MNVHPNNALTSSNSTPTDLRAELRSALRGRICLVGLGNPSQGDDGLGIRLAESLTRLLRKSEPLGEWHLSPLRMPPDHEPSREGRRAAEPKLRTAARGPSRRFKESDNTPEAVSLSGNHPAARSAVEVLVAGATPERCLETVRQGEYDQVVFLDAVAFGGTPGSAVFLTSREIKNRFPQISTHRLSLGTLAQVLESDRRTQVWLLGVEPESLRPSTDLTPVVQATLEALQELLSEINLWVPATY